MNLPSRSLLGPALGVAAFVYYAAIDTLGAPVYALYNMDPQPVWVVHDVWFAALVGFCVLIGVFGKTLAVPLWMLFASANGTEDLLYYLIQGKFPPYSVAYLQGPLMFPQPSTDWTLLFGLALSVVALPLFVYVERRVPRVMVELMIHD